MFEFLEKRSRVSILLAIFAAIVIFYVSSLSFEGASGTGLLSYFYHVIVFFWFGLFLAIFIVRGEKRD